MTSPHGMGRIYAAGAWGESGGSHAALCRKIHFPAQNGVRQFMRAGRPYCLSHGGNVAAGRRAKTPKVNGGTPSHATRDQPL
ncbi:MULTISPECIES: hypothetical protein [Pectobacterium]|uniref:hypothetical protein n=1 Tax=Pectobacterium TaxID=122277 RepID=UPI0015DF323D|nr:hypothetical protein [Pectobacterium aroidearum]MBA0204897.1 hypothetical protein [Pectobacterium aroidearum]